MLYEVITDRRAGDSERPLLDLERVGDLAAPQAFDQGALAEIEPGRARAAIESYNFV